jgi:hypothetical protein
LAFLNLEHPVLWVCAPTFRDVVLALKKRVLIKLLSGLGDGLALPGNPAFSLEAIGGWKRDDPRAVGIVSGCFLLIRKKLWGRLEDRGRKETSWARRG